MQTQDKIRMPNSKNRNTLNIKIKFMPSIKSKTQSERGMSMWYGHDDMNANSGSL